MSTKCKHMLRKRWEKNKPRLTLTKMKTNNEYMNISDGKVS